MCINFVANVRFFVIMNNLSQIVDLLEIKISKLFLKYDELKGENILLEQQSKELVLKVTNQQQLINDLKQREESLKIANTIVGSKEDKHFTKLKINTLIRDIDKCIIQLSEQ